MAKKKLPNESFFVTKRLGRGIHEHSMIPDGSRVLVALSGGVASLTMFKALLYRERRVPIHATYVPVHVPDPVFPEVLATLQQTVADWGYPLEILEPGTDAQHFAPIPHVATLRAAAQRLDANVIALGHTILDRAMGVMLPLVVDGALAELPVAEELDGIKVIRPLCHLTDEALLEMARAEAMPIHSPAIPRPDAALRRVIMDYISAKKGRLIEKLRNISNATDNVVDEYLA